MIGFRILLMHRSLAQDIITVINRAGARFAGAFERALDRLFQYKLLTHLTRKMGHCRPVYIFA